MTAEKWTLSNPPPAGHPEVGRFFWGLLEMSQAEKERLNLPTRWLENHRLWRGGSTLRNMKNKNSVTANLVFSNINRTVANLTAKNPVAEVVSLDGGYELDEQGQPVLDPQTGEPVIDETDSKITAKLKGWWNESEQNASLVDTTLQMETYGITIEKAVYDIREKRGDVVVVDPFAVIMAPGYYETLNDMPFVGQAYPERCDAIESMFNLDADTVTPDDVYSLMGQEREDNRPMMYGTRAGSVAAPSNYGGDKTMHPRQAMNGGIDQALVAEIWIRDLTKVPVYAEEMILDRETGEQTTKKAKTGEELKYPGGIRVVTITNKGGLVLADRPNPNVNPAISRDNQVNTYLYDHFPFWHAVSYKDTTSIWGFAAAEQVGDLAEKCSELLSRVYRYLARLMMPPLVIPQDTGLTENDVNNDPGLILTPVSSATSGAIRFVEVPSLPTDTWRIYEKLTSIFDRVYQIEDADRGDTPNRIIAASAIVALQERNAVLMRHKIRSVDYLIRQRGRAAISFFQNFGVITEPVKVDDEIRQIKGVDLIGRKFQFVVESGSTIPQTTLQVSEMAMDLAKLGKIDNQGLLEALQFPGWRKIVERMAESGDQLDQAAQIFIQAGVDEQTMAQLLAFAKQPQGGPGVTGGSKQPTPPAPVVTGG
jgi:hypothetical protein